jgi:3',5'-cyclic AMP phosphodiesterase CpdA
MLIAQITDSHVVEKEKDWLKEPLTKTNERLAKVVAHLNALHDKPDVVLFTGDLSDTSTPEAYTHLKELLKQTGRNEKGIC